MQKAELENTLEIGRAALIDYEGERGIIIKIGENLSSTWRSGEIIVFWEDGEQTILPDEFLLISENVFR